MVVAAPWFAPRLDGPVLAVEFDRRDCRLALMERHVASRHGARVVVPWHPALFGMLVASDDDGRRPGVKPGVRGGVRASQHLASFLPAFNRHCHIRGYRSGPVPAF